MKDFQRILNAFPQVGKVSFFRVGEPLLNKDFVRMVVIATSRGIRTEASTNLHVSPFGKKVAREIVRSGLVELVVSIDGASQDTYQQYRIGGRFDIVLRNLKELLEAKKEMRSTLPIVVWQYLLHRGNEGDLEKARRMADELGCWFVARELCYGLDQADRWAPGAEARSKLGALSVNIPSTAELRVLLGLASGAPELGDAIGAAGYCAQAWDQPGLDGEGWVYPCCMICDKAHALGNIFERPFKEIWNSPKAVALRRYLKFGGSSKGLPCLTCPVNPRRSSMA